MFLEYLKVLVKLSSILDFLDICLRIS